MYNFYEQTFEVVYYKHKLPTYCNMRIKRKHSICGQKISQYKFHCQNQASYLAKNRSVEMLLQNTGKVFGYHQNTGENKF